MSYKIVRGADGAITASGPNCDEFQPSISADSVLEIVDDMPVIQPTVPDYSAMRAQAYRDESDPLFFKSQRGEATRQEWIDKVTEIKTRWPE